ncbi:Fe-S cluster assembly ATPase SufC [Candidatus Bathyarchaeota archaeon]|nr:MAG: Fe-S cluster assembly ATPase SufC [Candidatus Hecatellales archaeon]RLI34266.1 MAG: Fe-S cluster assembly ATPase SufC [Candidatus Bathyarchaeota archaeon]
MLKIEKLSVKVEGKQIVSNVNLTLPKGKVYAVFGPNGSGKSTLLMAVAGVPTYKIISGKILFEGEDITWMNIDERARLGIALAFQTPPEIVGVKLRDMLKICAGKKPGEEFSREELELIEAFNLKDFLDRNVNLGFSGGERKRAEVLQLLLMKPKLMLLDEPDSGVDIESLKLIGEAIQNYISESGASALLVTHQGQILEHVKADMACVLLNGSIKCYGDPYQMLENIRKYGYESCAACTRRRGEEQI